MSLKFCANLGFLFSENPISILQKYQLARAAGFRAVEHPFPVGVSKEELLKVKNETGLEVALINIDTGTVENGQFGIAAFPNHVEDFKKNFQNTVDWAKMLNCRKIHIMAGKVEGKTTPEQHRTYYSNLKWAAELLRSTDIIGVIEPINHYAVPGYFLHDFQYAIDVLKHVDSDRMKLMVDLYHMQMLNGNLFNFMKEHKDFIGHVQIAQSPDRHEPNTTGEVDFKSVLDYIEKNIYNDWIGCEYKPKTTTIEGLNWVQEFGFTL